MTKKITIMLIILATGFLSCKKEKSDNADSGNGSATVTATNYGFDGGSSGKFSSTKAGIIQTTVAGQSTFAITAIKDGSNESMTITVLKKVASTGKITFGPSQNNGGIVLSKDYTKPGDGLLNYSTDNSGSGIVGGGEINVTALNGNAVEGTFYAVAFNSRGDKAFAEQGTFKGTIKQ